MFFVLFGWAHVASPQDTGQIFGKLTDSTDALLPGVTVTLAGPRLLQPRVAITSETGTYQFPGLAVGDYVVKFELAGFRTVVREQIQINFGFNAQINAELVIASVSEDVIVTGVSPVVDIRSTTQGVHFNTEQLDALPSTRNVFSLFQQAPALAVNLQNVGGATSAPTRPASSRAARRCSRRAPGATASRRARPGPRHLSMSTSTPWRRCRSRRAAPT